MRTRTHEPSKTLIAVMIFAATTFASALGAGSSAEAAPRLCEVVEQDGPKLETWRSGSWRAQKTGALSPDVQRLRTGPATRAELRCEDGIAVTLAPDTELILTDFLGPLDPPESVLMRLTRGLIGIIAPPRRGRMFEVRTPLAIASARSTEWTVDVAIGGPGSATVAVFVREGDVETRNDVGVQRLGAGEGVTFKKPDQRPSVKSWGTPRVDAMRNRLGYSWR